MRSSYRSSRLLPAIGLSTLWLGLGVALAGCSEDPKIAPLAGDDSALSAEGVSRPIEDVRDGAAAAPLADAGIRARLNVVYTNNFDGEIEPCG